MQTYKLHADSEFSNTVVATGRLFIFCGYANGVSGEAALRCKDSTGAFSSMRSLEEVSSVTFSSVTENVATLTGELPIVGVLSNTNKYWSVQDDLSFSDGNTLLDVSRFLMLENVASFAGEWEAFYASGRKGDPGIAGSLSIGTVTSGVTASAEITGTAPNQTLNLVLPKGDTGYGSAVWQATTFASSLTLSPANGENQVLTITGNCALTAPVLTALSPTLLLQINKVEAGYAVMLGGNSLLTTSDTGVFLIGWYFDGASVRRLPLQEVI